MEHTPKNVGTALQHTPHIYQHTPFAMLYCTSYCLAVYTPPPPAGRWISWRSAVHAHLRMLQACRRGFGIDRKRVRKWSGKYDELKRHSGGAPCGKATQAYHDKRASVCGYGSRSTPCSCAVDLHVLLYLVVRCSVRARWEGGRGFAVSPPKGGWRGGRTFAVQKSLNGNTCFQMEFWSRHIHIYSHNKHKK